MARLDGKVAVITGGARGIGKGIALTFAEEGADIVIGDIIDMESTAQGVRGYGRNAITIKTDVTKKAEVENLVASAINKFKKIDILVNDAGIQRHASFLEMSEKDWDDVIAVNLKGAFLCTQTVGRQMVVQKYGKIINIVSLSGVGVFTSPTNYGASKTGLLGLTRHCARDLGPYGINVNGIAPGTIVTDLTQLRPDPEAFIQDAKEKAVLGRTGTPQDIANVALFLASDESSFITGQIITADGGRRDRM